MLALFACVAHWSEPNDLGSVAGSKRTDPRRPISGVFLRASEALRFGGVEPGSRAQGQRERRSRRKLREVS
jgi:hypothetical protein